MTKSFDSLVGTSQSHEPHATSMIKNHQEDCYLAKKKTSHKSSNFQKQIKGVLVLPLWITHCTYMPQLNFDSIPLVCKHNPHVIYDK